MCIAAVAESVETFPCKHPMFGGWLMCVCLGLNSAAGYTGKSNGQGHSLLVCPSH